MQYKRYTQEQLIKAVKESTSIAQALTKLGLAPKGSNYKTINKKIKDLGLDTKHITGQGHNKGKEFGPKKPIEDYLSNKHPIGSHKLRNRLVKEKFFEHKCSNCNLSKWLEKLIPLELDHIDGNHQNNTITNLRLLCPNCHALTPTYRGKNKKS